jgi:hypothetical protein
LDPDPVIEIFSGNLWEAEMIKSLLKDGRIDAFLKNVVLNSYGFEPTNAGAVQVMILSSNLERARKIVEEYWQNMNNNKSGI